MKEKNYNKMFLIKTKIFVALTIFIALFSFVMVSKNRLEFTSLRLFPSNGQTIAVTNPFHSYRAGLPGIYTYEATVKNSLLFAGVIQIIADDCVEDLIINGKSYPSYLLDNDACDIKNGSYFNVGKLLKDGNNVLIIKTRNIQGNFGITLIDKTFYEKYLIYVCLIFFLAVLNWKKIAVSFFSFLILNKIKLIALSSHSFFFFISIICVGKAGDIFWFTWLTIAYLVSFVIILVYFLIRQYFLYSKPVIFLFSIAIAIYISYLILTPYQSFSYDVDGHIEYIEYMTKINRAPISSGGWMFYHPSFYYRSVSFITLPFKYFFSHQILSFHKTYQAFSLAIFILYCYVSAKIIDYLFRLLQTSLDLDKQKIRTAYFASLTMFLFWPLNGITSIRIGNDNMFYLLFTTGLYFALRWLKSGEMEMLIICLISTSFCIWTKSNGFLMYPILLSFYILRLLSKKVSQKLDIKNYTYALTIAVFFLVTFYLSFRDRLQDFNGKSQTTLIVGNASGLGSNLIVGNHLSNFISLNLFKFIEVPFTSSLNPEKGREQFWFYLLKTSMFGEFSWDGNVPGLLARILSFLLIVLICICFSSTAFWKANIVLHPLRLILVILLAAMIIFRVSYPYSCSNDFRYIYPAILPFVIVTGSAFLCIYQRHFVKYIHGIVIGLFLITSLAFQILTLYG